MRDLLAHIFWLAVCIYHEARGEPQAGQIAVAHAILNRVEKRDKSVKDIVLHPYQFSWANIKIIEGKPFPAIKDYEALISSMESAMMCLTERLAGQDFNGADHYYNDSLVSPSWAKKMTFVDQVGTHVFFRS